MSTTIDTGVRTRISILLKALGEGLYEREKAMRLALLSTVAGESIFLLGPPGVGKSLIARRLKYAFRDGTSFEYLMSKFSTPDEVFGPVSIKKLKEEDKYERLTDRYLPGANIVFLDEIWKAGPAIQNALLTILNEKIYRNGDTDLKVNIRGIITASNELPPHNQSLDPIWDRFLLRLEMGNIREYRNFLNMIVDTKDVYQDDIKENHKLTEAELDQWSEQIGEVDVPPEVLNTIQVIKMKLEEYNARPNNADQQIQVFDRRWKKMVRLMRTSAFLNGRHKVDLMDCFLMVHCLWNKPRQRDTLRDLISDAVRKHGYTMAVNLKAIRQEVMDFEEDVNEEIKVKHIRTEEQLLPIQEEYYQLINDDNRFEGNLITARQWRALRLEKLEVTNFYDDELNLRNRLKAKRGGGEFTIDVEYNSEVHTYRLRTRKGETSEIIFKKPHAVVAKYWDERHQRLVDYIQRQQERMEQETPTELTHLDDNLFVDSAYSDIVRSNMEEVREALRKLLLKLEKIQYAYASLEA